VSALSTQLSWSHFLELLPVKDPLARDFYAEMGRIERQAKPYFSVTAAPMILTGKNSLIGSSVSRKNPNRS
jgi:hypothetical protein